MKTIISDLYQFDRQLMGSGYDSALTYINHLIPLQILQFPTGTKLGTWTVPEEWVVYEAWVKKGKKKILDYNKDKLSLVVGSIPFEGKVDKQELLKHLHYSDVKTDAFSYEQKLYEKDWGFTLPKEMVYRTEDGKSVDNLPDGEYEVCIKTEYKPGVMKVGVHTIPGKTDQEILLFAHLDHAWLANDNLSGVACLIDLVRHIKPFENEHTIKLIFCPQTIGSIAYALTQDISMVSFVLALDSIGNSNVDGILLHRSFDKENRINHIAHLALRHAGEGFRHAPFRSTIGSDEYAFNDPKIGIPGIMLSTHPYPEYHTSKDTPETINYAVIEKVQKIIIKMIQYYERDFIPVPTFKGPLFRSGFGIQSKGSGFNMAWDYLIYEMGTKPLSTLCLDFGLNFEYTEELLGKLGDAIERRPVAR